MSRFLSIAVGFMYLATGWHPAHAAFLNAFAGNTRMFDEPASDGTVNLPCTENTDGNWTDDFPVFLTTFAGPLDTAAKYVYFYSVTDEKFPFGPRATAFGRRDHSTADPQWGRGGIHIGRLRW